MSITDNEKMGVSANLIDQKVMFDCKEFGLDRRLVKAIAKLRYVHATLVQTHCIPMALKGKDLVVRARTGSGKTVAFLLPILQKILTQKSNHTGQEQAASIKAVVLVPTKELVAQIKKTLFELMYYCRDVVSALALGGESMTAQQALLRDQPDILVITPAKLVAHLKTGDVNLKQSVETVVLDEADMLLSFGYENDIRTIRSYLPKICQCFFMSATLSPELDQLKKSMLHNPAVIKLEEGSSDGNLQQFYVSVKTQDKDLLVYALLKLGIVQGKVLFFVNSTDSAYRLKLFFEQFSIKAAVLNAQLPFNSRQHIIEEFNRGIFDYLIATDESIDDDESEDDGSEEDANHDNSKDDAENIDSDDEEEEEEENDDCEEKDDSELDEEDEDENETEEFENSVSKKKKKGPTKDKLYGVSRGIDFCGVTFVVNVDFPRSVRSYTHRIGRTARGGSSGTALTLFDESKPEEKAVLQKVQASQAPLILNDNDHSLLQPVENDSTGLVQQPAPLAFNMMEIDCFRYRVEDVRRAVTRISVREAQLQDVKKEMLNSERLQAHFEDNPRDLNTLQHDKVIGAAKVQAHLAKIPSYLVPEAFQATAIKKPNKKRSRNPKQRNDKRKRTDNDPLHTFQHSSGAADKTDAEDVEGDRVMYSQAGTGKSISGRQQWQEKRKKGRFNPRTNSKKKFKNGKGYSH